MYDLANAHATPPPSEAPAAAPPDPRAEVEQAAAFVAKETERWEQSFAQEPRDTNWARASEGQLRQITQTSFANVAVKDLECRSQTCRLTADVAEAPQQAQLLAFKLKESFPVVHFHHSEVAGQERYFVTKGDAPPADD